MFLRNRVASFLRNRIAIVLRNRVLGRAKRHAERSFLVKISPNIEGWKTDEAGWMVET
jgi:hypothetical protein